MEGITSPPVVHSSTKISLLSPLLISTLGIVVTAAVITAYHFILVKFCARRHASTTAALQPPAGVDEKVLKTIEILAFATVKRDMDQLEECVVCLGELEDEDMVRLLPECKHAFHVACIDRWFAAQASCPLCRSQIQEQANAARSLDPNHASGSYRAGSSAIPSAIDSSRAPLTPPIERPFGSLHHCASVVLPPLPKERRSCSRLKRSLSMDQSLVVISLQSDYRSTDSSSSSAIVLTRTGSCSRSLDRLSSKWIRSLQRLRMGKGCDGPILPY